MSGPAPSSWPANARTLLAHVQKTAAERDDLARQAARQLDKTERLRGRTRALERILAVSARINGTRQLAELVDRVVAAAADILGFDRVILYLWSDADQGLPGARRPRRGRDRTGRAGPASGIPPGVRRGRPTPACAVSAASWCVRTGTSTAPTARWSTAPGARAGAWSPPCRPPAANPWATWTCSVRPAGAGPARRRSASWSSWRARPPRAIESAEVYDRLARNNAELSLASEKLASLADMKANFVANVSHELRTPLTSISAYTELLQQNLASMSRESLDEFLKVIHTESHKLTAVINDILELSQMENGRPLLNRSETDVVSLVRRLEDGWRSRAAEAGLDLRVEAPAAAIAMPVDPVLLQQLLTHLLANAFKFTPEGGRVTVGLAESGTALRLTVQDTGIGIPDRQARRRLRQVLPGGRLGHPRATTGRAWAWPSATRSSPTTTGASGPRTWRRAAPASRCCCPGAPRWCSRCGRATMRASRSSPASSCSACCTGWPRAWACRRSPSWNRTPTACTWASARPSA